MSIPNNTNAEKIGRDEALALAKLALKKVSENCYFLSDVAEKCGTYRHKFDYVLRKFNDDEEIFEIIHQMRNKCEAILVKKAARNKINPAVGIFILKSYHGLMETSKNISEVEVNDLSNVFKKAISRTDEQQ